MSRRTWQRKGRDYLQSVSHPFCATMLRGQKFSPDLKADVIQRYQELIG